MVMKEYSAFPKAPALLEPHLQCYTRTLVGQGVSYPSTKMQLVYSADTADWAEELRAFQYIRKDRQNVIKTSEECMNDGKEAIENEVDMKGKRKKKKKKRKGNSLVKT